MTNIGGLDSNNRRALSALSNANDGTIVNLWADPITHRLLVSSSGGGGSPGGSNTQIQFNDNGSFGGNALMTFDKSTGGSLTLGASAGSTNTNAGGVFITGGEAVGNTSSGGQISITSGFGSGGTLSPGGAVQISSGGSSGGNNGGGFIHIICSNSTGTSDGDEISLTSGSATGSNASGGNLNITSGSGFGDGNGGDIILDTGHIAGGGRKGQIVLAQDDFWTQVEIVTPTESTLNHPSTSIYIKPGTGNGSGGGGNLFLNGGDGGSTNASGGDVKLIAGLKGGVGTNGHVTITDPSSGVQAWFETSTLASSNKIFTFPNASGVLALQGLSGTKIYYVSDSSGGAVTRKLTFTNGVLTAET